jgi:hypothetical protein
VEQSGLSVVYVQEIIGSSVQLLRSQSLPQKGFIGFIGNITPT